MTFLSVAQASGHLGIDAKTLRRWLAQAQLPLQRHPRDGRKKGVSSEHLLLLARLHQRSLAPLPEVPPAPVPGEVPALPAVLLALPEQLSGLQSQIAALQQQVTDLSRLLEQHRPEPALPAASTQQAKSARRPSQPASPAPRSRPAAKPPRKPVHVIPRVEYGEAGHYVVICPKHGLLPLEPDTPEWFAWLATQSSFRFVGKLGPLTAHRESQCLPKAVWRAHRKVRNHTYNQRLGHTQGLTITVLEQAAAALQAYLL